MSGFINNHLIYLQNVYLVPKLNKNLISINELIKNNYKIIFNNNNNKLQAIIYNNKGTRIITITSNTSNNFKIWITSNKYNFNKINNQKQLNIYNIYTSPNLILWHRRLAHFDITKIKNKLLKIKNYTKCPICSEYKQNNKSFYPSINKSRHIFELLHIDLVGPVLKSIYGNIYFMTILDDFSRFGWVLFFKSKKDTYISFIKWFTQVKKNLQYQN